MAVMETALVPLIEKSDNKELKESTDDFVTTSQISLFPPPPTFTTLPPEILLNVASRLTYPDALSLKHTSHLFHNLVYTGVNLKIEWLIERRRLHLDCPRDQKCELGSDRVFCRGSVALLMKRRREHVECDIVPGGRGCLVFGTAICTSRKSRKVMPEWRRSLRWIWGLSVFEWLVILGLLVVLLAVGVRVVLKTDLVGW